MSTLLDFVMIEELINGILEYTPSDIDKPFCGFVAYILLIRYSQKKKSSGVRYGDRGGYLFSQSNGLESAT